MGKLISSFIGIFRSHPGDDLAVFLIATVLSNVLLVLAIISGIVQYVARPIDCFLPASFTDSQARYMSSFCQGSLSKWYPIGGNVEADWGRVTGSSKKPLPFRHDDWLPMLLLWHAVVLRLPRLLWLIISNRSGLHLRNLVSAASCHRVLEESGKTKMAKSIAGLLYANYSIKRTENGVITNITRTLQRFLPFGILGLASILTALFLASSTTSAYRQLNYFLSVDNNSYDAWDELQKLKEVEEVKYLFPSMILCDASLMATGTVQHYSVQCYLPASWLYSVLCLILWMVYILSQILTWIVFVHRLIMLVIPWPRISFIRNYLAPLLIKRASHVGPDTSHASSGDVQEFMKNHIRMDGYFVLKSLAESVDDLVVYDVVQQLWRDVHPDQLAVTARPALYPAIHQPTELRCEAEMKQPLLIQQGEQTENEQDVISRRDDTGIENEVSYCQVALK